MKGIAEVLIRIKSEDNPPTIGELLKHIRGAAKKFGADAEVCYTMNYSDYGDESDPEIYVALQERKRKS